MMYFASSVSKTTQQYNSRFCMVSNNAPQTTGSRGISQSIVFCQGHGTSNAAEHVNSHLLPIIHQQIAQNPEENWDKIMKNSYKQVQNDMQNECQSSWKERSSGHSCLSGTSATVALVTSEDKLILAHLGGSAVYHVTVNESNGPKVQKLTKDHHLDNLTERVKILAKVGNFRGIAEKKKSDRMANKGDLCVAWDSETCQCLCQPNFGNSHGKELIFMIPLSRSLGDFWAFNKSSGERILSNTPDFQEFPLERNKSPQFLLFLSRNVAALINELYLKFLMQNFGESDNPAILVLKYALNKMKSNSRKEPKLTNVSVLIIPIFPTTSFATNSLGLELSRIEIKEQDGSTQIISSTSNPVQRKPNSIYLEAYNNAENQTESVKLCVRNLRTSQNIIMERPNTLYHSVFWRKYISILCKTKKYKKYKSPESITQYKSTRKYPTSPEQIEENTCTALAHIPRVPAFPQVSINLIQYRPIQLIRPLQGHLPAVPVQHELPVAIKLDAFKPPMTYLIIYTHTFHMLAQLTTQPVNVPGDMMFYGLPCCSARSGFSSGYHLSENLIGKMDVLRTVRKLLQETLTAVLTGLGYKGLPPDVDVHALESMESIVERYVNEEIQPTENLQVIEDKTLLFTMPAPKLKPDDTDVSQQLDPEVNHMAVHLLPFAPSVPVPQVYTPLPDLPAELPGLPRVVRSGRIKRQKPDIKPNSVIIRTKRLPVNIKKRRNEQNANTNTIRIIRSIRKKYKLKSEPVEANKARNSNRMSVSFMNRGCGGQCIVSSNTIPLKEPPPFQIKIDPECKPECKPENKPVVSQKRKRSPSPVENQGTTVKNKLPRLGVKQEMPDTVETQQANLSETPHKTEDTSLLEMEVSLRQESGGVMVPAIHIPEIQNHDISFSLLETFDMERKANLVQQVGKPVETLPLALPAPTVDPVVVTPVVTVSETVMPPPATIDLAVKSVVDPAITPVETVEPVVMPVETVDSAITPAANGEPEPFGVAETKENNAADRNPTSQSRVKGTNIILQERNGNGNKATNSNSLQDKQGAKRNAKRLEVYKVGGILVKVNSEEFERRTGKRLDECVGPLQKISPSPSKSPDFIPVYDID